MKPISLLCSIYVCLPYAIGLKMKKLYSYLLILFPFCFTFSQELIHSEINEDKLNVNDSVQQIIFQGLQKESKSDQLELFLKAKDLIHEDSSYFAILNYEISVIYRELGQYNRAFNRLKLTEHFSKRRVPELLNKCYGNKSILYLYKKNYDDALFWRLQSKALAKTKEDSIIADYNLLTIHVQVSDTILSQYYLNNLLTEIEKNQQNINPTITAFVWINALNISKNIEEKERYFSKLKTIKASIDSNTWLNVLISQAYFYQKINPQKAIGIYSQILENAEKTPSSVFYTYAQLGLIEIYLEEKKYKQAENILKQIEPSNIEPRLLKKFYKLAFLTNLYGNKIEESLRYNALKYELIDSIYQADKDKKYLKWSTEFKTELKESENIILKQKNELQSKDIEEKKWINQILFVSLLLLISIILLIFYKYKLKKNNEELLELRHEIIALNNKELRTANHTKSRLFEVISHDLLNPFQSLFHYINKLETDLPHLSNKEIDKAVKQIKAKTYGNYEFVNRLLLWSKSQSEKIELVESTFNLNLFLDEITTPQALSIQQKNISLNIHTNHIETLVTDRNILSIICTNILSNAIKNTSKSGRIEININRLNNKQIGITFSDTGAGISEQDLKKINAIFKETEPKVKTEGLGFVICSDLLDLLNGSFHIDSELGLGTVVTITFNG